MAKRSRSEELKKGLVYVFLFTVIYTIIVFLLSFIILEWSWGEKQNTFTKVILFILQYPLKPEKNLFFIPINGFTWGIFILLIYKAVKLLKYK